MKACILAAGDGTRMWPLTEGRPKPLLPVLGEPILIKQIRLLKKLGMSEVHILVGHLSGAIVAEVGDGDNFGVKIHYHHQRERLGTAHAISMFKEVMDEDFICMNGDVLFDEKVVEELLRVKRGRGDAVMTLKEIEKPEGYGVIEVKEGRVVRIYEKPERPPTNLVNAGIYIFPPEIFSFIEKTPLSPRGEYEITDTLQMMADEGKLLANITHGFWMDLATPWDLLRANEIIIKDLKGEILGEVEEGVHVHGEVFVGKGSRIRSGSYIEGPVYIGEECEIGPNAYLRPGTVLVKNVKVGAASEVKNSVIMEGSKIPHHNYVGDSVIGRNCNLGSGTKVANLRHDGRNVTAAIKGRRVDTGRRKFGVVLGDNVKTGINTSLNVGTILGKGCVTYPGARVSGTYASGSIIK
ncbi:MAG: NTP transferase domain-containing protein [Thermoplasmata archaeon]|nr:NTP transferase domain-containing protein [Thermoplasmata archaeon]